MFRTELQRMAKERLKDAEVLLRAGQWSAAYYLVGYAIEFALKSCIMHDLEKTGRIFKDRDYLTKLSKSWTHNLKDLLGLSNLGSELEDASRENSPFAGFWGVVKDWKETSRYEQKTEAEAQALCNAITNEPNGVLRWIQNYW